MSEERLREILPIRLRHVRKMRGLNQLDLAQKCGLQSSYISQIEKSRRLPSLFNLLKLSAALEISIDYLTGRYVSFDKVG